MGAGHSHQLHVDVASPVHNLPAHIKIVCLVTFVLAVVATPREAFWAFAIYAGLLAVVRSQAQIPVPTVFRRMVVEIPFIVFAILLPFVALGERTDVLGVSVSLPGLWGAWNILIKGTLGVIASILLAATTQPRDLIVGLQRLRVPQTLVQITAFMLRYTDVVVDDMRRMRIARESRGFEARNVRQIPVLAQSAGAMFIRTYERGERVHLAMLSRGYTGSMPVLESPEPTAKQWLLAGTIPAVAVFVCSVALVIT